MARSPETKGERTRRLIVERAAPVFNVRGIAGTSMADVVSAVGLQKGGVYNHFASKDELALAAFDHAAGAVLARLEAAVAAHTSPRRRLLAMLEVYRGIVARPTIAGGCPLLNAAVEADDTHPALRERVRGALHTWLALVADAAREAVACGELRAVDPDELASAVVAGLEGGIMLARLYRDPAHMERTANQLARHVAFLTPAGRSRRARGAR